MQCFGVRQTFKLQSVNQTHHLGSHFYVSLVRQLLLNPAKSMANFSQLQLVKTLRKLFRFYQWSSFRFRYKNNYVSQGWKVWKVNDLLYKLVPARWEGQLSFVVHDLTVQSTAQEFTVVVEAPGCLSSFFLVIPACYQRLLSNVCVIVLCVSVGLGPV